MNKLLMAGVAAALLLGAECWGGAPAVAAEGYGGAPITVADACGQPLAEAEARAAADGWRRLADFKEPALVGLLTAYLSMKMEKSLTADMVSAFDRGPEGLLVLTNGGCVVGVMGGLKQNIDKALAEFRANGPAA